MVGCIHSCFGRRLNIPRTERQEECMDVQGSEGVSAEERSQDQALWSGAALVR